jgi:L-alanine-DL-glutamate epimerase-like enolase superfamily enzyme
VQPVNGIIRVPTQPGMGVELDPAKIEEERELDWEE